jgi:hypothetical protein
MACGQQEPLSCKGHKNTSHLSCPILPSFLTHSNVTLHAYKMKQPLSMHKLYIAETIKGNKHQKDGTFWMHHPTSSIQVNSSHCKLCSITTQCIKQKKIRQKSTPICITTQFLDSKDLDAEKKTTTNVRLYHSNQEYSYMTQRAYYADCEWSKPKL